MLDETQVLRLGFKPNNDGNRTAAGKVSILGVMQLMTEYLHHFLEVFIKKGVNSGTS